ncbi:MAG: hypothetical protein HC888_07285 [Candidatus Competibacteraceae bacterium]|nr:hypothetical protein [Candidatus Competibacteraceae bacterium]
MQTVKQPPGSGLCVVCCVAMVTGVPFDQLLQEVKLTTGENGVLYCSLLEQTRLMAKYGWVSGLNIQWANGVKIDEVDDGPLDFKITLHNQPAILTVESEGFPGFKHAVVYDPSVRMLRDPADGRPEITSGV